MAHLRKTWPPPHLVLTAPRDIDSLMSFANLCTGVPDLFMRVDACITDPDGSTFLVSLKPL